MKVVTVASDLANKGFSDFLDPSCQFYHFDAIVLECSGSFYSNRLKDAMLEKYLEYLSDDEIVFFTDATDAVFIAGEEEILEKFNKFESQLVFSAEVNCWPDRDLEDNYPGSPAHFKYLNSGGFIGKVGYLKHLYEKYPIFDTGEKERYFWSNQYYWNLLYKEEWPHIQLDHDCQIFYNTCIPILGSTDELLEQLKDQETLKVMVEEERNRLNEEIIFTNGRVTSRITNSLPCHFHFAGTTSKLLMEEGYFDSLKKQAPMYSNYLEDDFKIGV